ncbi:hypothetical protein D3C72_2083100 [compost metagenome]
MLDDFPVEDHVEGFAGGGERFRGHGAIVDLDPRLGGMGAGDADIALGGVRAEHVGTHPGDRLGEQPAAAADVEDAQAFERAMGLGVAAEMG